MIFLIFVVVGELLFWIGEMVLLRIEVIGVLEEIKRGLKRLLGVRLGYGEGGVIVGG